MNKKGQLGVLEGLAGGIAALAIILVVAFLIMSQGLSTASDLIDAETASNESVIGWTDNSSYTAFTFSPSAIPSTIACTSVYNGSGGVLVTAVNYTCDNNGIIFSGDNSTHDWNATGLVTYTYKTRDQAYNSTVTLTNATQDVPGWVPLIVIAVIGSMLLGLVSLFRRRS